MDKPWLNHYPHDVPAHLPLDRYASLAQLLQEAFARYAERTAYVFMGSRYSFARFNAEANALAGYWQSLGLNKGDRVAIMLPNVPQYPPAVASVMLAGMVLVNVNPLYTGPELAHQLKDSGAKAILILENFAHTLSQITAQTPVKHVVVASMGESLPTLKGLLVNTVVRHVKKLVPRFDLPQAVRYSQALASGRSRGFTAPAIAKDDIAVLQYTGGTTGVSKGAVLLHRNLVANVLQCEAWFQPALRHRSPEDPLIAVAALPLYHIFGFTVNLMLGAHMGAVNLLIPNPRDLPNLLKVLAAQPVHLFPAVNTLFNAIANHPQAKSVDWSQLAICVGGGMAVQQSTAARWQALTGCVICEGYGLSETSPVACCNPTDTKTYSGTIGPPVSDTEVALLDDDGRQVAPGTAGEIAIRGPQVMASYWQRPDETAKVMTADGFFRSGDIGMMDERGFFRIVDRKKDMILVSGFNVYPNEIEDVVTQMPGVLEAAAVGVPDEHSGEAVKVVVVKKDPAVTEEQVRQWCTERLTNYKRPRVIAFAAELPKTPVGKVLRRELRDVKH